MMTFHEFLHGDRWARPLFPDDRKAAAKVRQQANGWRGPLKAPEDNKIIAMIVRSGQRGVTRSELGSAVTWPTKILDEFLAMLVRNRWVTLTWDGANTVYRTGM